MKTMKGAEAIIRRDKILKWNVVVKDRVPKKYRIAELDRKLRKERTKIEARLLHKAKIAGVRCPTIISVEEFSISMIFIKGKRPEMYDKTAEEAGRMLALLHAADIIHGDFTPANILLTQSGELYVIDFGLGFFSNDIEDKAIDVYTMLKSLNSAKTKNSFLEGYSNYEKNKQIEKRITDIEKRVRYA